MRTIKAADAGDIGEQQGALVDWKADPSEVLAEVDDELYSRGLEVVMIETGDDTYLFRIEKWLEK